MLALQGLFVLVINTTQAQPEPPEMKCNLPISVDESTPDARGLLSVVGYCFPKDLRLESALMCNPQVDGYFKYCAHASASSDRQPGYPSCPFNAQWGGDVCIDRVHLRGRGYSNAPEPSGHVESTVGYREDAAGNWIHWSNTCDFGAETNFLNCAAVWADLENRPCVYGTTNSEARTAAGDLVNGLFLIWALTPIVSGTCT